MAEPIEIIIRKGSGGSATGFGQDGFDSPKFNPKGRNTAFGTEMSSFAKNFQGDKAIAAVTAFGIASMKKGINYGISQYGNMTGNYIQQAGMQFAIEQLNTVASIAGAGITGMMASGGNVYVGAVAAGIAAANTAINYGFQIRSLITNIVKTNTYSNIMRERSGNTYSNGSRGTDY